MFRNYLKTAVRNLLRYKGFALVNIASLTIGIIGCLVIGLFVWDEKQFDRDVPAGENIYRLYEQRNDKGSITYAACVPPAFTPFLKQQYPEVEATARILMSGDKYLVETGGKEQYEEKGWFADPGFFKVFQFRFLKGDVNTALSSPQSVVISREMAERYFGKQDPIGKTIRVNKSDMQVTGVFADLPRHFHFDFNYLMTLESAGLPKERMERWTWHQFYSYVRLKPGADAGALQEKFQAHVKKEVHPGIQQTGLTFLPLFQPLKDIHLHSADFIYDNAIRGNATYVKGLSIIAVFVLLIACFNFINLATARSLRRAKEIGVRKVVGAGRRQLVVQFIGETVLLSVLSTLLACVATFFIVPVLNAFTGKEINFNPVTNPMLGLLLLAAGLLIGFAAGIYPAFILSGFKPVLVLKGMKWRGGELKTGWLRKALVVVQFSLSALLIVSATIVYRQIRFLNNRDLGFNKDQVIYFQVQGGVADNIETFKNELRRLKDIVSVTSGYGLPGDQYAGDGIIVPGNEGDKEYTANVFIGDFDYTRTLGLKLVAGRDFSREMSTDAEGAFLINETAVRELGMGTPEKALGRRLHWNKWLPDSLNPVKKGQVIGVVQDFHYKSLHEKVTTSVIQVYPGIDFKVAAKIKTGNIKETIKRINDTWNKFSPGYPMDYKFMDETYGKMYSSEEKLGSLLWIFTMMAILVGCMGLFALAAFNAEQRTREIGIRKVLGASTINIAGLLSKGFVVLVLLASLIAFPVAWWAMNKWLNDFPYRVNISWWIFVFAGAAAVVIALLTVSFQAIRAALVNPVKSLRTE